MASSPGPAAADERKTTRRVPFIRPTSIHRVRETTPGDPTHDTVVVDERQAGDLVEHRHSDADIASADPLFAFGQQWLEAEATNSKFELNEDDVKRFDDDYRQKFGDWTEGD
jgi:hypothetical protein